MSDDLVKRLRDLGDHASFTPHMHHEAADRIEELEAKLARAVGVATLALDAVHEVQTYEQPDDPYTENALTMCELDAFDFDVEAARITIAELTGGKDA